MKRNRPILCITGGHLTPALAVIDAVRTMRPTWDIVFIGRKFARERDSVESEEYRLIREHGIRFHTLTTGRITRSLSSATVVSLAKLPVGFIRSFTLMASVRPDAVLTFGGYLGLPVGIAAWITGVPLVIHEQTASPGLTNRLLGRLARRVLLADASAAPGFPGKKVRVTGLPLRQDLFSPPQRPPFPTDRKKPLLYITGGATGARSMNRLIFPVVPRLIRSYELVHQVGRAWEHEARRVRAGLRGDRRPRYHVVSYLDTPDHAWMMRHADLIIGRSGANTVGEAAAMGKACLFIPLPWSAGNEQYKNAQRLVASGSATIADQMHATPASVADSIDAMMQNLKRYRDAADRLASAAETHAADKVVEALSEIIS